MSAKVRLLRIKRDLEQQERTNEIAEFLSWCTDEELWFATPVLWQILPAEIQNDYSLCSSTQGLEILYDSPSANCNFRPMLRLLLERWERVAPAQFSQTLKECAEFLAYQRARTQKELP